jgi:putative hemolysin
LRSACIINIMAIISTPFVRLLEASTNLVMKLTGMNKPTADEKVTEDEIRSLIVTGHIEGVIKEEEKELLENVFRFDDLTAAAIMTPRINVFAINIDKPLSEYIDEIIARGFSRVPVYERDIDNIIGILHVKDLLREGRSKGFNNIKLRDIMRKPYFVPEYMKIDILFRNMQKTKNQIAILIDEYGGSVGIVTIEDLVEEIVGNIYDEYDAVDETIQPIDDKTYLVDAGIQIQELNRRLKLHLEENNEEYDTLGGMVIYLLGYIPTEAYQDEINYDNLVLKVHKVNANRIEEILLTIKEQNG